MRIHSLLWTCLCYQDTEQSLQNNLKVTCKERWAVNTWRFTDAVRSGCECDIMGHDSFTFTFVLFCFSFGLLTDMGFLRPLLHSWPIFSRQSRSIWVHCIFVYPFCLHYLQTHATNIVCRAREVNNT